MQVACLERVLDGAVDVAVLRVPEAGPAVQVGDGVRGQPLDAAEEHAPEEVVIAVPVAPRVERDHEDVAPFQRLEDPRAVLAAGDRVADGAGELLEHGGRDQELLDVGVLTGGDLVPEVLDEEAVVDRHAREDLGAVGPVAQRQPHQVQPCHPPFGARLHAGQLVSGERERVPAVEELGRLRVAEPQLLRPELGDLGLRPEPAEPQRRVGLARDDDVGVGRETSEEIAEVPVDRPLSDLVVVVEDDRQRRPHTGELVDDDGQDLVGEGDARRAQPACGGARKLGRGVADGGHEIGPEADGVVVALVDACTTRPAPGSARPTPRGRSSCPTRWERTRR